MFDFDGTLCDLPVDIEPVRAEIAAALAARGFDGEMRPLLPAIDAGVAAVEPDFDARAALRAMLLDKITEAELLAAARAAFLPGVVDALAALNREGIPWGIATDNSARAVTASFAELGASDLLAGHPVCGRGDVANAKPAPDAIVEVVSRLELVATAKWRCFVIGDSPRDIASAKAAAARLVPIDVAVIAVLGGRGDEASLRGANPDHVAASFAAAIEVAGLRRPGDA